MIKKLVSSSPPNKSYSRSYCHAQCASIKLNKNLHTTNYVIIIFELYGSEKNWRTISITWLIFISIFHPHTNIIFFVFNSMITTDNNRNSTSTKKIFSLIKKICWMNFDFLLMGYGLSNYARARSKRNLWLCVIASNLNFERALFSKQKTFSIPSMSLWTKTSDWFDWYAG